MCIQLSFVLVPGLEGSFQCRKNAERGFPGLAFLGCSNPTSSFFLAFSPGLIDGFSSTKAVSWLKELSRELQDFEAKAERSGFSFQHFREVKRVQPPVHLVSLTTKFAENFLCRKVDNIYVPYTERGHPHSSNPVSRLPVLQCKGQGS
jgi:hypothetical protein